MKKKDSFPFIARGAQDLPDYLAGEEFKPIRVALRERKFTAKSVGLSYRVITHWDEKGILPEGYRNQGDGWRKFSLPELLWISVLIRLRNFGLPLDGLASVTKEVMGWNDGGYPLFEYYLTKAFVTNVDPYVFVFESGESTVGSSAELESNKTFYKSRSNIQISLKSILVDLGFPVSDPERLISLSSEEQEIVNELRSDEITSLKVKKKNGKWYELETSEIFSENPNLNEITKNLNELGEFAEVLSKFSGGVNQSTEVRRKKRL